MTNPVNIRVDKNDRDCAKVVLDAIGMDVNTAVTIYLREIVRSGGIP
ncbi:MAG: type II toxin-antitoxin system RelB/DinJ family antitoxin, partial [Clostridia bacterium]|nr:type II toxin-antitoxin system RelB/DinJ family antitoxin [Clostridia bacterium]